MTDWQPYREPLRTTLTRTVGLALVAGTVLAIWMGRITLLPVTTLLMLWPSLGGHWVEIWFLNWLRPRIPASRGVQILARLLVWFAGGVVLATGMCLTTMVFARFPPERWPLWWYGGLAFIVLELVVQLGPQLRGRPSFYNGRG
jgi:hypothetical protein